MSYIETELKALTIVGVSVRTSNQNGKAMKDIGDLFAQFYSENIIDKIENRLSDDIYCVYTDYESDWMGEYTVLLGCNVASYDQQSGLDSKYIAASNYRKYTSSGNILASVGKIWHRIWRDNSIPRKYAADFDVYGVEAQNPDDGVVYTYLSIH